jgi:hypothetical protein
VTAASATQPEYRSCIVRFWREAAASGVHNVPWLAQVELLPSGETHCFTTPDALLAFLLARLAVDASELSTHP